MAKNLRSCFVLFFSFSAHLLVAWLLACLVQLIHFLVKNITQHCLPVSYPIIFAWLTSSSGPVPTYLSVIPTSKHNNGVSVSVLKHVLVPQSWQWASSWLSTNQLPTPLFAPVSLSLFLARAVALYHSTCCQHCPSSTFTPCVCVCLI